MNPQLRIGDAEREAAITALGEHFAAGRIDDAEYEERSSTIWAARTAGALTPPFADLPEPHPTTTATRSEPSARPRSAGPGWPRFAPLLLLGPVIALVVVTKLPWFLILIAAWIVCVKVGRFGGHRSRGWHGPYGRRWHAGY